MASDIESRRKPADHVNELKDLVVGYAKQETVDPLKTLGRYLGFGLGGALCIGVGCVLLLMALLRGLQSWGSMDGNTGALSLVPYVVTLLVGAAMIGVAIMRITKDDKKGSRS